MLLKLFIWLFRFIRLRSWTLLFCSWHQLIASVALFNSLFLNLINQVRDPLIRWSRLDFPGVIREVVHLRVSCNEVFQGKHVILVIERRWPLHSLHVIHSNLPLLLHPPFNLSLQLFLPLPQSLVHLWQHRLLKFLNKLVIPDQLFPIRIWVKTDKLLPHQIHQNINALNCLKFAFFLVHPEIFLLDFWEVGHRRFFIFNEVVSYFYNCFHEFFGFRCFLF